MFRLLVLVSAVACTFGAVVPNGMVPLLDGRIVGGEETTIEEFPYQISMRYLGGHRCGGSIISERVIVSAAHCIDGISHSNIKIVVGATYRSKGGRSYSVDKIIKHEDYSRITLNNDISLLILSEPIEFSDSVQPIELADQGEIAEDGAPAFVSGWGALNEGSGLPDTLQYVKVHVVNPRVCEEAYLRRGNRITDQMLCAGVDNGGRDSCQGDSGGPLMSGNKLIGVVSWGYGCARPTYPGVYARVSALRNWIATNSNF